MASTYTTNLGIEKIGTGEQSGTWGNTTNTNLDILDEAISGILTVTLSSAGSSGSPTALPITDGSSSNGRNKYINFADGGDLGGTAYVQLTPNNAEKIVFMRNSLSSSRSIIVFQGTYNASNDFEIPNGKDVALKFDGGGSGATVTLLQPDEMRTGSFTVDNLNIDGNTIISTDSNGNIALTPNGTGEVDISKVDIDSGAIDGTTIGASSAVAGTFAALGTSGITCSGNITVADAGTIGSASDTDAIAIGSDGDVTLTQDLELQHDGATLSFGANDEIVVTHVHDLGLNFKNTLTADNTTLTFRFETGETDIDDNEVMCRMSFVTPGESSGTVANYVNAAILTVADADFSSSVNSTRFQIHTKANTAAGQGAGESIDGSSVEVDGEGKVFMGYAARYYQNSNPNITSRLSTMDASGNFRHDSKNASGGDGINIVNSLGREGGSNVTTYKAVRFMRIDGEGGAGAIQEAGSIEVPNFSGNVSFNTTSDYRVKENIVNITDGITRVKQLLPRRFNWKVDPNLTQDGFIAHEAQAVVPESVTGTKDAVDSDGKIIPQSMDSGKLIPILTAALQEAIAKIETLETKVAVLESK